MDGHLVGGHLRLGALTAGGVGLAQKVHPGRAALVREAGQGAEHLPEHELGIAHDAGVDGAVMPDLSGVGVHHDKLGVGGEARRQGVADDEVRAGAEQKHGVRLLEGGRARAQEA